MLTHSPSIVRDGLVLALDAANPKSYPGTGTTWYDLSSNGYSGSLIGSTLFVNENKGAMKFNGSTDYVDFYNLDDWNSFGSEITVECIYRFTSPVTAYSRLISKMYNGTSTVNSCFQLTTNTSYSNIRWSINGIEIEVPTSIDTIYNVSGTYDGQTSRLYINGKESANTPVTGTIRTSTRPLTVGAQYYNSLGQSTNGYIYNVRIYNRKLSDTEVKQNFDALRGRYGI